MAERLEVELSLYHAEQHRLCYQAHVDAKETAVLNKRERENVDLSNQLKELMALVMLPFEKKSSKTIQRSLPTRKQNHIRHSFFLKR